MNSLSSNEIWLMIDSRQFGGIETHVLQLAQGLVVHNYVVRVLLINQYSPPSPLEAKLTAMNIPYQGLCKPPNSALNTLIRLIRQKRPFVIHAHGYKANLIGKIAKLLTGTTLISTYHAGETPTGRVRVYDWLDRLSAPIANQSIAVSAAIQHKLFGSSIQMKNFIDVSQLSESHGNDIAFVGRLSAEKAPQRFVALAEHFTEQQFHLYGTGPLEATLTQNQAKNVYFHGHQTNMDLIWPTISIVVICSEFEGLPLVALEAMARGIVVIATSVGELPNLIQDGRNGLLVNDPCQLPQALNQWLSYSTEQQQQLRQAAIDTIKTEYSQNAIIPRLNTIYQNAAK